MALTRKFRETVAARAQHDKEFREALWEEAMELLFEGNLLEAKRMIRDCINATMGFEQLSVSSGLPTKSLMRMLGPTGNPNLANFVTIVRAFQQTADIYASVTVVRRRCEQSASPIGASSTGVRFEGEDQVLADVTMSEHLNA